MTYSTPRLFATAATGPESIVSSVSAMAILVCPLHFSPVSVFLLLLLLSEVRWGGVGDDGKIGKNCREQSRYVGSNTGNITYELTPSQFPDLRIYDLTEAGGAVI